MRVAASWCMTPNVGDALTPWLIKKLGLYDSAWVSPGFNSEHYLVTGSVLNWSNEHSVVWGAGLASWKDEVNPGADIRAVRGPLSLMRARSCGWARKITPPALGDPALLVPILLPKSVHSGRCGIVPHYVDMARFNQTDMGNVDLIDPLLPVEEFCAKVSACSFILSSSLHGLIIADAYGIPNEWAKFGDGIGGDSMKYWDHFASVGRAAIDVPPVPQDLRLMGSRDIVEQIMTFDYQKADPAAIRKAQHWLVETCPFLHDSVERRVKGACTI